MKIKITVRELSDRGCCMEAFDMLGINEWALNEGQIDYSEELEFTQEQAEQLGLFKKDLSDPYGDARYRH